MRKKTNNEAKLAVAQVYWNNDQEYKQAETRRSRSRDLALVAIAKGETVGPVQDSEGMAHWLTHGEKERVEMDAWLVGHMMSQDYDWDTIWRVFSVDVAKLRERWPNFYLKMLKYKSTKRTTHSCLTWSEKPRRVTTRAKRS